MAKDDYPVIAYQVLSYLYQRLKKGLPAEPVMLRANGGLIKANERYWEYIIWNLQKEGYIEGVVFVDGIDNLPGRHPVSLEDCMITPKGIEYLTENSFIRKAYRFLKGAKEITPFNLE